VWDAFPSIAFIGSIALAFAPSLFVIAAWGGFWIDNPPVAHAASAAPAVSYVLNSIPYQQNQTLNQHDCRHARDEPNL
jgi:hypothetical protein